jgi:hypothetical protein
METIRIRLTEDELRILNKLGEGTNRSVTRVIKDWINATDTDAYNIRELFNSKSLSGTVES